MDLSDPVVLRSARLTFRPFAADERGLLRDLHADPDVQRYLEPDGVPWTETAIAKKLALYRSDFEAHGWTKFAVFDADRHFIGRAGFSRFETGELELGFSFARRYWGRGYATEAGRTLLGWIYGVAPVDHVVAFAMTGNAGSIAVLDRIGMTREADRMVHGAMHAFFVHRKS